ncbi:hypothetical protein LTR70_008287 [Exophiala xenobiotica]|uniref:N-acetyltransferase domain-containing protein n=1 Tax=Lithohypha guttulata TaxID=1690604 RepID=A0ABR0K1V0_9EURO|nr:hypothetical protein LTR24_007851 [Lithohypha guttulata]KAK5312272.1 hypothetical protein LTR70_008287 [Exophiala xenobiotica]
MANNPLTPRAVASNTELALISGPELLIGKHVTLERLTQNHFSDLYGNVGSHNDLWTWWPDGPFSTAPDFVRMLNALLRIGNLAIYAILLHSGPHQGKAVGCAFAQSKEPLTNRVSEIGVLFGPRLQRTRPATEVLFLLCRLLFEKLNYRRMAWKCDSLNLASRRAAQRYGLVYEGTFRQAQIVKGRNRDTCWYSMIDSEWPMCKKVYEKWLEDGNFDEHQRQRSRMEEIRESLR